MPRFWPDKLILNFKVFNIFKRGKLFVYLCLKHHTDAATCIRYISETGIPNVLLCLRGPFRVNSLCSELQFADHLKRLLHAVIDSVRYEVLKVKRLVCQEYQKCIVSN